MLWISLVYFLISLSFCFLVIFSNSSAEEAEATVQGECGRQEAQAAEGSQRGTSAHFPLMLLLLISPCFYHVLLTLFLDYSCLHSDYL